MDVQQYTRERQDGEPAVVLAANGEVDAFTAGDLDAPLNVIYGPEAEAPGLVVVDLSDVEFLDSTGLGVLVKALKRSRESGSDLRVVVSKDRIHRVFTLTGLDEVMAIYPTLEDALA